MIPLERLEALFPEEKFSRLVKPYPSGIELCLLIDGFRHLLPRPGSAAILLRKINHKTTEMRKYVQIVSPTPNLYATLDEMLPYPEFSRGFRILPGPISMKEMFEGLAEESRIFASTEVFMYFLQGEDQHYSGQYWFNKKK